MTCPECSGRLISEGCEHVASQSLKRDCSGGVGPDGRDKGTRGQQPHSSSSVIQYHDVCRKCGARRIDQQLGLEATPELYIERMVEVFREVRRILRDDGCLFLNLGDNYAASSGSGTQGATGQRANRRFTAEGNAARLGPGLKPKDLCMMPSRLALALQADGWWIRSMMPWVKRSAMPESCTDRPTSAIEYVFLLTSSAHYFFDAEAVRVKYPQSSIDRMRYPVAKVAGTTASASVFTTKENAERVMVNANPSGRNFRNSDLFYESLKAPHGMIFAGNEPVALDVNPEAFPGAHFATFPRKLVAPLLKAGTSERGCCPECGAPWKRIIEQTKLKRERPNDRTARHEVGDGVNSCGNTVAGVAVKTLGWQPGCGCAEQDGEPEDTEDVRYWEPVPCTCFDPFTGSGTVGVVAKQLGLSFIGIELNAGYATMARERIENPEPEPVVEDVEGQRMLFEEN